MNTDHLNLDHHEDTEDEVRRWEARLAAWERVRRGDGGAWGTTLDREAELMFLLRRLRHFRQEFIESAHPALRPALRVALGGP